jgi:hypothetical protein
VCGGGIVTVRTGECLGLTRGKSSSMEGKGGVVGDVCTRTVGWSTMHNGGRNGLPIHLIKAYARTRETRDEKCDAKEKYLLFIDVR